MNIKEFFDKQTWIFAKTYAKKAPHEYFLKDKVVGSAEEYENAVKYIFEKGFRGFYYRVPRTYLIIEDKAYWVCTDNIDEATLINRCKLSDYDIVMYPKKEY